MLGYGLAADTVDGSEKTGKLRHGLLEAACATGLCGGVAGFRLGRTGGESPCRRPEAPRLV